MSREYRVIKLLPFISPGIERVADERVTRALTWWNKNRECWCDAHRRKRARWFDETSAASNKTHTQIDKVWRSYSLPDCDSSGSDLTLLDCAFRKPKLWKRVFKCTKFRFVFLTKQLKQCKTVNFFFVPGLFSSFCPYLNVMGLLRTFSCHFATKEWKNWCVYWLPLALVLFMWKE